MTNEERFIQAARTSCEGALARFFDERRAALSESSIGRSLLLEEIEALTLRGGKRLRPILIAAAAMAADPSFEIDEAAPLYVAIELLQTALLIHDDIMDEDELRRGGPSTYASLRARLGDKKRGDAAAILAGDYAAGIALEALLPLQASARLSASPEASSRLLSAFSAILEEVYHGQLRDVLGDPDVPTMHRLKTTSYTTLGPIRLGAILGGASGELLQALERWAISIGEAFQIADDLLGVIGDAEAMGKPGDDLRDGKKSALSYAASERGEAEITALYALEERSEAEIARLDELLRERGIIAYTRARIGALEDEAKETIHKAPMSAEARALFLSIGARLTRRER